jgi:site-specific recombinase XerD
MVPDMFKEAGVEEKKTSHSLHAAGVSQLFEAGVDEKAIQSRSSHRCLESL